jgi:hypothetical protein
MFIRARKSKDRTYYPLVRGYRDDAGKVRHETLGLGTSKTVADALEAERHKARRARRERARFALIQFSPTADKHAARFDRMAKAAERRIAILESAMKEGVE